MMPRPLALVLALDLVHTPTLAPIIQRESLPNGVLDVIKIAAGCPETTAEAARLTKKKPRRIRAAAVVYLQTALFSPYADHYRVLGVTSTASRDEIRSHMRWLMKWLHPDRQHDDWQSRLAERVLSAWDELKTPERRARYDQMHPRPPAATATRSRGLWRRPWLPWIQWPAPAKRGARDRAFRLAIILIVGVLVLTILVVGGRLGRTAPAIETPAVPTTNKPVVWSALPHRSEFA